MTTVDPSPSKQVPAPPDQALVSTTVRTRLPGGGTLTSLTSLAGDASNRRYFRITLTGGPISSVMLMQLAEPEAFKQSEEAVSGATATIEELPFVNVRNHLAKAGVPVPRLYHYDQAAGLLYLEDFGDVTLTEAGGTGSHAERADLYHEAIETLVWVHQNATTPENTGCLAFHRRFDVSLLMWEFDHFLEYGVVARHGKPMCADDEQPVRAVFLEIAEELATQPRVFTHRDYHSRNLMVRRAPVNGHRLGVLDFQDALMGPATYDLASLLRDAYIELEESLIDELIDHYLERMARGVTTRPDRASFRRLFDFTSIQRNLKAAGRFVYIDRVKKNPKFLDDIPRTLGYVRRNLAVYPELAALRKHLTPYVPELQ